MVNLKVLYNRMMNSRLSMGLTCIFLLLALCKIVQAQNAILLGDLNHDGVIDTRDALMIMRAVEGLDTLTNEDFETADVYPIPGLNGRAVGDGSVTEDDVLRILYQAAGLLPIGELTGDYSDSSPTISDFEPQSGSAGTEVTIIGSNFVSSTPGENAVFFGDVEAEIIRITGTEITVLVPDGVHSGQIIIRTPGGTTVSGADFDAVELREGVLNVGTVFDPQDFTVVSKYGETDIQDANGGFSIPVAIDKITIVGAVPKGEEENSFLLIHIPKETEPESIVIDEHTTAVAVTYFNPFFITDNLFAARMLMETMETVPEVQALADVIAARYPQTPEALDDEEVEAALIQAVNAVMEALPEEYTIDLDTVDFYAKTRTPARYDSDDFRTAKQTWSPSTLDRWTQLKNPSTSMYGGGSDTVAVKTDSLDLDYIKLKYDRASHSIFPKRSLNYSPLDWLVALYKVDPVSMPKGIGESYFTLKKRRVRLTGYEKSGVVEANLWTAKIDVLGELLKLGLDFIQNCLGLASKKGIALQGKEDSIYMLRAYSGVFWDHLKLTGDDKDAIPAFRDGPRLHNYAVAMNVVLVLVDVWAIVSEKEGMVRDAMKKGLREAYKVVTREAGETGIQGNTNTKDILKIVVKVVVSASKKMADAFAREGLKAASEKMSGVLQKILGKAVPILGILKKISKVGKVGERILGMTGYVFYIDYYFDLPIGIPRYNVARGPTPLEVGIVMVGDPFIPVIESISPTTGGYGTVVTINGRNFAVNAKDNVVKFNDIKAEVLSSDNQVILKVRVPDGLPRGRASITVDTPASMKLGRNNDFNVDPAPVIESVSPLAGYGPSGNAPGEPFAGNLGMEVTLTGYNMRPIGTEGEYKVFFGDAEAEIISQSDTQTVVRIPKTTAGAKDLFIRRNSDGRESKHFQFTIWGRPVVDSISSRNVMAGELIVVKGANFTDARVQIGDTFASIQPSVAEDELHIIMPNIGEEGDSFPLKIWNQANQTTSGTITRKAGVKVPELTALPRGMEIPVQTNSSTVKPDGIISLAEAVAFANGSSNPFEIGQWDNANEKWTLTYNQIKLPALDEDGNYVRDEEGNISYYYEWVQSATQKEVLDINNGGAHETREVYHKNKYHSDIMNGTTITQLSYIMDIDAQQQQEGDFVNFIADADFNYKTFNGGLYADRIYPATDMKVFKLTSLQLGEQDTLAFSGRTIELEGSLIARDGCMVEADTIRPKQSILIEQANRVIIYSGTIEGANSDGVKIRSGYGNTIYSKIQQCGGEGVSIQYGGKNNIDTKIISCGGHGVEITNSDQNDIVVNATSCTGSGISIDSGDSNQITLNANQCGGDGITILKAKLNHVTIGEIRSCNAGVHLNECEQTTLNNKGGIIRDCRTNGVTIEKGWGNSINAYRSYRIFKNNDHGIEIINSSKNYILGAQIAGNECGIVIRGSDSYENTISSCYIGRFVDPDQSNDPYYNTYSTLGNRSHGMYIYSGANDNVVEWIESSANQGHGILLEGSGVTFNDLYRCTFGIPRGGALFEETINGNSGDGVRIQQGASDNTVVECYIHGNSQNGITLKDSGTSDNWINECEIGVDFSTDSQGNKVFAANHGYGIEISSDAALNDIDTCEIAVNDKGGILCNGLNGSSEYENSEPLIHDCVLGYERDPLYFGKRGSRAMQAAAGSVFGIHIKNSQNLLLARNKIYYFDTGLVFSGSTRQLRLEEIEARKNDKYGFYLEGAIGITFTDFVTRNNALDGVFAQYCSTLQFIENGLTQLNGGSGMYFEACDTVTLFQVSMGLENGQHGLSIDNSSGFTIQECNSYQNDEHGVLIANGSSNIQLLQGGYSDNVGIGLKIVDSSDVELVGYFSMFFNQGGGVFIENSGDITIGKGNQGGIIDTIENPCLVITGEDTQNIYVYSNTLADCEEFACVQIDGGSDIWIGGWIPGWGNYIGSNENVGILAEGVVTNLYIINNIIGGSAAAPDGTMTGNSIGVLLRNGLCGATISENIIQFNESHGIHLLSTALAAI